MLLLTGGASEGDGTPLEVESGGDSPIIWFIFLLSYSMSLFLLALRWKRTFYVLSKNKLILVLLIFTLASVLWSVSPDITLRRVIALAGTTFFGCYLAVSYSLKQLLQLLAWTFAVSIILSFIFIIVLPKYGTMGGTHTGVWRGIYVHKNGLGKTMVASAIVFLLLALDANKNSLVLWSGFFSSIVLLVSSKSTTSLLTLIAMIAIIPMCRTFRWRYEVMIPTLISIILLSSISLTVLTSNSEFFLLFLGKDPTLTGRTDLWITIFNKVLQHPLLGYGFNAFWLGWNSEASDIWRIVGWTAPNAHNGWLDLLLDLGFLGASIFILVFGVTLVNALAQIRWSQTFTSLFPLLNIMYLTISNIGESKLLRHHDINWVLYVAVSLLISIPHKNPYETGLTKAN